MKKTITLSSLTLLLFLNFSACDTKESDELGPELTIPKTNTDQLVGEWEWEKTYTGWIGWETPSSKGYRETLILDKNNTFRRLRDGVVTDESYYYITKEKSTVQPQDSVLFIHLLDKHKTKIVSSQPLYEKGTDTIMTRVMEECWDCAEAYFVRKKLLLLNSNSSQLRHCIALAVRGGRKEIKLIPGTFFPTARYPGSFAVAAPL